MDMLTLPRPTAARSVGPRRPRLGPAGAISPPELGTLLARAHRAGRADRRVLPWWADPPVGSSRWDELVTALGAAGPRPGVDLAVALARQRAELVALDALVERARTVQPCHRRVDPDSLRRDAGGRLCVIGWGELEPADPGHDLAAVLHGVLALNPARSRELVAAYRAAGGHGTVDRPGSFSLAIVRHGRALEAAVEGWLQSRTPAERDRRTDAVERLLALRPTRPGIDRVLDALATGC